MPTQRFSGIVGERTHKLAGTGLRLFLALLAAMTLLAPGLGFPAAAKAQAQVPPPLVLTAAEIVAAAPAPVLTPLAPNPMIDSRPALAGLPDGTSAEFVIKGVVTAIGAGGLEWQIGIQPVFVYLSDATRVDNFPAVGDMVKVIANRTLAPGPLVADRITRTVLGPLPASVANVEMSFSFTGLVTAARKDTWTIGGNTFIVNDPAAPAAIDVGLGVGSMVTVSFTAVPAPAPAIAPVPAPAP